MTSRSLDWNSNEALAVGKGATVQEFTAIVGANKLVPSGNHIRA